MIHTRIYARFASGRRSCACVFTPSPTIRIIRDRCVARRLPYTRTIHARIRPYDVMYLDRHKTTGLARVCAYTVLVFRAYILLVGSLWCVAVESDRYSRSTSPFGFAIIELRVFGPRWIALSDISSGQRRQQRRVEKIVCAASTRQHPYQRIAQTYHAESNVTIASIKHANGKRLGEWIIVLCERKSNTDRHTERIIKFIFVTVPRGGEKIHQY